MVGKRRAEEVTQADGAHSGEDGTDLVSDAALSALGVPVPNAELADTVPADFVPWAGTGALAAVAPAARANAYDPWKDIFQRGTFKKQKASRKAQEFAQWASEKQRVACQISDLSFSSERAG